MWKRLRKGNKIIHKMRSPILASIGTTSAVLVIQYLGLLQLFECVILDQWFRLRPPEHGKSRIVIVTIDEKDVSRLRQWPISDRHLAKILRLIKEQQPHVIGLNLYRNFPVQPGHEDLTEIYKSTPNLIGIEKLSSNEEDLVVKPPVILDRLNQVAASDLILDTDGNVRRILLSMRKKSQGTQGTQFSSDNKVRRTTGDTTTGSSKHETKTRHKSNETTSSNEIVLTLGAKLALEYLEKKDIRVKDNPKTGKLILGKAQFEPISENVGGYVGAKLGGYQILANFHRLQQGFERISISDILDNPIHPDLMKGKIVIIGSIAESTSTKLYTPYTRNAQTAWTGVELHANIASQIIASALDGRAILKGLPEVVEYIWIFIWSLIGASIGWKVKDNYSDASSDNSLLSTASNRSVYSQNNYRNSHHNQPLSDYKAFWKQPKIWFKFFKPDSKANIFVLTRDKISRSPIQCLKILIQIWRKRPSLRIIIYIHLVIFSLFCSTYLLFLTGYWITLAAPSIACISSIIFIRSYSLWRSLQISHRKLTSYAQNLEHKVQKRTKQLQEKNKAVEKAKQEAEAANLAKSTFLANMSHELRTPLNIILGFTQVMGKDSHMTKTQEENLEIINRSGEHLLSLINDILEISKIEAGKIIINNQTFDLFSLLETLKKMFDLKAASKGLELIFDIADNLPQHVESDEGKLRQVLINLLGNAIKFTEQGNITLRVNLDSNIDSNKYDRSDTLSSSLSNHYLLLFEVEDTGSGINSEDMDRIFHAFEQVQNEKKSIEGTGLGLVITKKFIQTMGGNIQVDSQLHEGSKFSFSIPVKLSETFTSNGLSASAGINSKKTYKSYKSIIGIEDSESEYKTEYKILIVDDHDESRQLLFNLLTSLGFSIRQALNGREAISIFSRWKPDLICMDIQMPVMNGYEAIQEIKSSTYGKSIPIVALSAYAFQEDKNTALSKGFDDFISKPIDTSILLDKISQHLKLTYIYLNNPQEEEQTLFNDYNSNTFKKIETELKQDLSQMSSEWVKKLYTAACICDDNLIFELIAEIPSDKDFMKERIRELTKEFRFDKIIDLTQELIE